ncbi:hypothetical protein Q5P01_020345 [Channa striata]|uniref:C-type lectin domain-containing protein n=1 Tax=Channa striata TaxID=64152 RepID=A0AA88LXF6_CHASR|nr:hypothetical protein Q5P01_020345 [Channa striata]
MENQWERASGYFNTFYDIIRQGGPTFHSYKCMTLGLGLLNAVLLIVAVVIGIKCARVKEGSLHVSHSAVTQLLNELDYLRSNHSDVMEAEEEAKKALERALKHHEQLKEQIDKQKTINDGYQRQIETLKTEKTNLQSNISALEGTCGRCLPGWSLYNSSCYFFSRADCVSRGADLVVIDSPEEQTFVSDSIEHVKNSRHWWDNGFWVGLIDIETEGTWVWINNVTEVEQRYWIDGEPNDAGHVGEDCAIVVSSSDNPWKTRYDARCDEKKRHWICEVTSK